MELVRFERKIPKEFEPVYGLSRSEWNQFLNEIPGNSNTNTNAPFSTEQFGRPREHKKEVGEEEEEEEEDEEEEEEGEEKQRWYKVLGRSENSPAIPRG